LSEKIMVLSRSKRSNAGKARARRRGCVEYPTTFCAAKTVGKGLFKVLRGLYSISGLEDLEEGYTATYETPHSL
jgi:hypothetical protein